MSMTISERTSATTNSDETSELQRVLRAQYDRLTAGGRKLTGEQVQSLFDTLHLPSDEHTVDALLPRWADVSFDELMSALRSLQVAHDANPHKMLTLLRAGQVQLGPVAYLRHVARGGGKQEAADDAWTVQTATLSCQLPPRVKLFLGSGVVMMLTCAGIVLLMGLLWRSAALERERSMLRDLHGLLRVLSESFAEHSLAATTTGMVDNIETLSLLLANDVAREVTRELASLQESAVLFSRLADLASTTAATNGRISIAGALGMLPLLFPQGTTQTVADLLAVITDLDQIGTLAPFTIVAVQQGANGSRTGVYPAVAPSCAYGPCDYLSVACLSPNVSNSSAQIFSSTTDINRRQVTAVALTVTSLAVTVCGWWSLAAVQAAQYRDYAYLAAQWNGNFVEPRRLRPEAAVLIPEPKHRVRMQWLTPRLHVTALCYDAGTCFELDAAARLALLEGQPLSRQVVGYSGEEVLLAASPGTNGVVVVVVRPLGAFLDSLRSRTMSIFNDINAKDISWGDEITVAGIDPTTTAIDEQLTIVAHPAECLGDCSRLPAATAAARDALLNGNSGAMIGPDYRPAAVVAAYAPIALLNIALVLERPVTRIRSAALAALTTFFNDNNAAMPNSLEAQLLRPSGMPVTRTYDPSANCNYLRGCERSSTAGVLYRSDCPDCLRLPAGADRSVPSFVTDAKLGCYNHNCSRGGLVNSSLVLSAGASATVTDERNFEATDATYGGLPVFATWGAIRNLSTVVLLIKSSADVAAPFNSHIALPVGLGVLIAAVGLAGLLLSTGRLLDRSEREYVLYKSQLDDQKVRFAAIVARIIPASFAGRHAEGQTPSITLPNVACIMLDQVGFSATTRGWDAAVLARYLGYVAQVTFVVAEHFGITRIRVFGDTFFGAAGVEMEPDNTAASRAEPKYALRAAQFGAVLLRLVSPTFAHYPHLIPSHAAQYRAVLEKHGDTFPNIVGNSDDVGCVAMPSLRIGLHQGPVAACLIATGRSPAFDLFGATVATVARLQATAQPGRIHVTVGTADVIESEDPDDSFAFDPPRRTVVRGQGPVSTCFINSADIRVAADILDALCIEYANARVDYTVAT